MKSSFRVEIRYKDRKIVCTLIRMDVDDFTILAAASCLPAKWNSLRKGICIAVVKCLDTSTHDSACDALNAIRDVHEICDEYGRETADCTNESDQRIRLLLADALNFRFKKLLEGNPTWTWKKK